MDRTKGYNTRIKCSRLLMEKWNGLKKESAFKGMHITFTPYGYRKFNAC